MHSLIPVVTVLLVSAVHDIVSLPASTTLKEATPPHHYIKDGKLGRSKSMSSASSTLYRGPVRPSTTHEAIAIIDSKHDDQIALTHLRRIGRYSKVNAIISGVENKQGAHGSTHEYKKEMTKARWLHGADEPFMESRLQVFEGGHNPLEKAAPHERTFGKSRHIKHQLGDLSKHLHPSTTHVDVFHLGPIKHHDLKSIFDQTGASSRKVGLYHVTAGYNNLQAPEHKSDGAAEKKHLQELHTLPHNKDARTALIQTNPTFGSSAGGTQGYAWAKSRSVPSFMRGVTTEEPFHLNQFSAADEAIAAHNEKHKDDKAKQIEVPDPVPGKDAEEKQANIWAGREKSSEHGKEMAAKLVKGVNQRQKALRQIQEHDKSADHGNTLRRLDAVKDGLENECQIETCDGNHVAVSIHAHYSDPDRFVPVTVKSGREIAPAKKGEERHGVTLVGETSEHARQLLGPSFPSVFGGSKPKQGDSA